MEALESGKQSRNGLTDISAENTDGFRSSSKRNSPLRRGLCALTLFGCFALFAPSAQQVDAPNSLTATLAKIISDLTCPHLYAQFPLPSATYSKMLGFLLYDPEKGNERLVLSSGDKAKDVTDAIGAQGFESIEDISMDGSENTICAAFDTTDDVHNWEIIKVEPTGEVTSLTNTAELDEKSPSVSNDQNKLAYVASGSIFVEEDGVKTVLIPNKVRSYIGVRWTPENRLLVTVEEKRKSYIAEIDLANPRYLYRLTYSENKVIIRNPVISPDGKSLVYVNEKGGNPEIVIADRYGSSSRILSFGDNIIYSDSATMVFSREFNSQSHLFFTDESGVELEAIIPGLINDSGFFIRSISSYTPFIIPPETPEEAGTEENAENKEVQPVEVPKISKGYRLSKNYPDPFNPTTTIQYEFPSSYNVRLEVLNIRGQLIRTLVDEWKAPGRYSVDFDGRGLSSGVYFYRLIAGDFTRMRKMVLMK